MIGLGLLTETGRVIVLTVLETAALVAFAVSVVRSNRKRMTK